jgi:hypothetical protein
VVVDYEAAWVELQAIVASKPQHGADALLREMARIAHECRVAAGEPARMLRLYGVEVHRLHANHPDASEALAAGLGSAVDDRRPGHHDDRGGRRDGSRIDGAAEAAGSGRHAA